MEAEMDSADEIRERICLAMITIDEALEMSSAPMLVQNMPGPEMRHIPIQYHGAGEATQGGGGHPIVESTATSSTLPTITVSGASATATPTTTATPTITATPTTTTASSMTTTWPMSVPGSMPAFIFSAFDPEVTIAKAPSVFATSTLTTVVALKIRRSNFENK